MPGQVIHSQAEGMDWLMIDAKQGTLKTGLTQPEKNIRGNITEGPSLTSSTTIMDGKWHRVGLVWDGAEHILDLDNMEIARDTIESLTSCKGSPLFFRLHNLSALGKTECDCCTDGRTLSPL